MAITIKSHNSYDIKLFILLASLAAGSLGGILQLPRTFSILFLGDILLGYRNSTQTRNVVIYLALWFGWAILSLIWTPDFYNGISEGILLLTNFILFVELVYYSSKSKNLKRILSSGWGVAFFITGIISIWELLTGNHLSTSKHGSDAYIMADGQYVMHTYAAATFVNFNSFVVFICYSIPFLMYGYFSASKILSKIIYSLLFIVAVVILFMNASRGGILALIIQVFFFFSTMFSGKGNKIPLVGLITVMIVALCLYWDEIAANIMLRTLETTSFQEEARYDIWIRSLKCFFPTVGIGTGVGSIAASMTNISSSGDVLLPHNAFLEILVQYGVVIGILCLRFVLYLYKSVRRIGDKCTKALIKSSILSLLSILIIDSSYLISPSFWAFFASLYIVTYNATFQKIS